MLVTDNCVSGRAGDVHLQTAVNQNVNYLSLLLPSQTQPEQLLKCIKTVLWMERGGRREGGKEGEEGREGKRGRKGGRERGGRREGGKEGEEGRERGRGRRPQNNINHICIGRETLTSLVMSTQKMFLLTSVFILCRCASSSTQHSGGVATQSPDLPEVS